MILKGYGVTLVRLKEAHLELLRQHRNSPRIQQFMEFREEITPEMQREWFAKINNRNHNYFLIHHEEQFVGQINGTQVDWEKKETRSGGIFVWDESLWKTMVPLSASFLLTDISFLIGLERTYIKVLRDNPSAATFNRQMGYEMLPGQEHETNQEYVLTRDAYEKKTAKYRRALRLAHPEPLVCLIDDPGSDASKHLMELYPTLPAEDREQFKLIVP